jgi:spermidine/putrescine transport system ATP-binding protein
MQFELKRLQREVGITFIYVTHDQEEALTMSDRIAVMNHGKVLQVDDSTTLYDRPSTRFVASFIGTSNFLTGQVTMASGGTADVEVPMVGTVRASGVEDVRVGSQVILMIRPERLRLSAPTPGDNNARGRIEDIVFVGNDVLYLIRLGDSSIVTVRGQNQGPEARMTVRVGEDIDVSWPSEATTLVAG